MKKILFLTMVVLAFTACSDNLTDLNENTKDPLAVPPGMLVANSMVEFFDWVSEPNVNRNNFRLWAQHWAQTTYPDESNYELNERNVNGRTWDKIYATVLRDVRDARALVEADQFLSTSDKANQLAVIDVIEVVGYTFLVDIFGDIPYTDAFPTDPNHVAISYDDDAAIYDAMITKLDGAIKNLGGATGMGSTDLIYNGDGDAWKAFANSYKLRLAIRLADLNNGKAQAMAEEAVASGVITSAAGNFQISYQSSTPNTNPMWEQLIESGRSDFVAANTFADALNALDDPRRPFFFKNLDSLGNVTGGTYGDGNSYAANSQPGTLLEDPTLPGIFMSISEVNFLLADAVERGYNVGGTAEEHYNAGVTTSIMEWGGDQAMADAYLANPDVAYTTAPGTWQEKVAMQKWIALYNQGFEAWTTYRIYGAPTMNVAVGAGTLPPTRYTYPRDEFDLNQANMQAASDAIGGDDLFTRVFWDVN